MQIYLNNYIDLSFIGMEGEKRTYFCILPVSPESSVINSLSETKIANEMP